MPAVSLPSPRVACPVCRALVEQRSERAVPWCGRCDEARKACPDLNREWIVAEDAASLCCQSWLLCEQRSRCDDCRGPIFVVEADEFPVQWRVHCFPEGPCVIQSLAGAGGRWRDG